MRKVLSSFADQTVFLKAPLSDSAMMMADPLVRASYIKFLESKSVLNRSYAKLLNFLAEANTIPLTITLLHAKLPKD